MRSSDEIRSQRETPAHAMLVRLHLGGLILQPDGGRTTITHDRRGSALLVRVCCITQAVSKEIEGQNDNNDRHHREHQPGI